MIAEKDWAIITNDRAKAKAIFDTILLMCDPRTTDKTTISKSTMSVVFSDGTRLVWHMALMNSVRGVKCSRLWCDKNIDKNVLEHILYGNCYIGEEENIIWI